MDDAEVKAEIEKNKREPKKRDIKKERARRTVLIKHRHRVALEELKKGNTFTGAMIASGFKPTVVRRGISALTGTKSWQALMDEQLPEDVLVERHRELLDMRLKKTVRTGKYDYEEVDAGIDPQVLRAVELGYKLRGRTMADTPATERPNVYNLFYSPIVQANVKAFEDVLKNNIAYAVDRPTIEASGANPDSPAITDVVGSDTGTVAEVGDAEGGGA